MMNTIKLTSLVKTTTLESHQQPFSFHYKRTLLSQLTLVALLGTTSLLYTPAHALTINLIDTGTSPMTAEQMNAFNQAAAIWENKFNDPITLTLNVSWDQSSAFSSPTILASTTTARTTISASTVRACMRADSDNATEKNADTRLPTPSIPTVGINGVNNQNLVTMAFANSKALGVSPALDPVYGAGLDNNADGQIRYNLGYLSEFDFDRNDGIDADKKDFIGVAAHEIGHALGFFSVTDVQDANPAFDLHPNTLDLWRFEETAGSHNITSETRLVTADDAEFHDDVVTNIPFSRGFAVTDPLCNSASGKCQASHWQDDQGNLMDPTLADGIRVDPVNADTHALDYIGYNKKPFWAILIPRFEWIKYRVFFYDLSCVFCAEKLSSSAFQGFPKPPGLDNVKPPFKNANVAFSAGFSGKQKGFESRSGTGFATFEKARKNKKPTVLDPLLVNPKEQWETEELATSPLEVIPAHLTNFYFESDKKAGMPFSFTGVFSENGSSFDPNLGKYGGFRISGVMDASADGVKGDIDATSTVVLLLQKKVDINRRGIKNLPFSIEWQDGTVLEDNSTTIIDYAAFKLPDPKRVKPTKKNVRK